MSIVTDSFDGLDVLSTLSSNAGLSSVTSCAESAGVSCQGHLASNAAMVLLNWLAGTSQQPPDCPSPTPSDSTDSATPSPTATHTPTATPTPTLAPTSTPTLTPTPTPRPSAPPTPTPTASPRQQRALRRARRLIPSRQPSAYWIDASGDTVATCTFQTLRALSQDPLTSTWFVTPRSPTGVLRATEAAATS